MNINKAIRKQKKIFLMFMLIICFIFFANPIMLYISGVYNFLSIASLIVIELLLIALMINTIDKYTISYEQLEYGKLLIKDGIRKNRHIKFDLDNIIGLHSYENDGEHRIIIFSNKKVFSTYDRVLGDEKFKRDEALYNLIKKMKIYNTGKIHYYIVVKGKYKQYELLKYLYTHCFNCVSSSKVIEIISQF